MQVLKNWKNINEKRIISYLDEKKYTILLNEYCKESGLSQVKLAKQFGCSRKALMRYQAGIRNVPMGIVKSILQDLELEYPRYKGKNNVKNCDSVIVWPWKEGILFNVLFLYRKAFNLSLFDAACRLDIQENTLRLYEGGEKKISLPDVGKILDGYNIKINDLFPELVSYDGGKTYLPLKKPFYFRINNIDFNIEGENFYKRIDDEWYYDWHNWPIYRYDSSGKPLLNYMPEELTVDEYLNTDSLLFIKDNLADFYNKSLNGIKLPPNYRHLMEKPEKNKNKVYKGFRYRVLKYKLTKDYHLQAVMSPQGRTADFDLQEYVFSDSPWYSMLQDLDYFKRGQVKFIGDECPENQCIVWPDGQYIRIIELYIDKYKYRYFAYKTGISGNSFYDCWTSYAWV